MAIRWNVSAELRVSAKLNYAARKAWGRKNSERGREEKRKRVWLCSFKLRVFREMMFYYVYTTVASARVQFYVFQFFSLVWFLYFLKLRSVGYEKRLVFKIRIERNSWNRHYIEILRYFISLRTNRKKLNKLKIK